MRSEIIHIGRINHRKMLLLRKISDEQYGWFEESEDKPRVVGTTVEEAIRLAKQHWKMNSFCLLPCGYRFTLPERDEHGMNALFWQAVRSFDSVNGIYYDEDLGHNCIVHQIPLETQKLIRHYLKGERL
ncbi:MAG: hypothetical protein ACSNEK_06020 [Parachlamydiaceae bacterium]